MPTETDNGRNGTNIRVLSKATLRQRRTFVVIILWLIIVVSSLVLWRQSVSRLEPVLAMLVGSTAAVSLILPKDFFTLRVYLMLLAYAGLFVLVSTLDLPGLLFNLSAEIIGAIIILIILDRRTGIDEVRKFFNQEALRQQAEESAKRVRTRVSDEIRALFARTNLERPQEFLDPQIIYHPSAVEPIFPTNLEVPKSSDQRPLISGTQLLDVFFEFGGRVLILGKPGAGKTTMLLRLARQLLGRAEADESQPLPLVYSLQAWPLEEMALVDWVSEQLTLDFSIPPSVISHWLTTQAIQLLLDGLDTTNLPTAIARINEFLVAFPGIRMVITSRPEPYFATNAKLKLNAAVVIQPLDATQIADYLKSVSPDLLELLSESPTVAEITSSPLLLRLLAAAYGNTKIVPADSITRFLAAHVDSTLQQEFSRVPRRKFSKEDVVLFLATVARRLETSETSIVLESEVEPHNTPIVEMTVKAGLLVKTSGGYQFAHRIIQEYFANMNRSSQ